MSKANLEGKGYLQFPKPIAKELLEDILFDTQRYLRSLMLAANRYKEVLNAENAWAYLHAFSGLVEALHDNLQHPADFDRIIADTTFFDSFSTAVHDVRESGVIEFAERYSNALPDGEEKDRNFRTLQETKGKLLQSDIYLASRLDKDKR